MDQFFLTKTWTFLVHLVQGYYKVKFNITNKRKIIKKKYKKNISLKCTEMVLVKCSGQLFV